MSRSIAIGSILGISVGSAATWFLSRRPNADRGALQPNGADLSSHPGLKYGIPVSERIEATGELVLALDSRLRNPKWVIEHLTKEKLSAKSGDRGNSAFYEDPKVPARFRSKLDDYRGSGFDRGHMAPASNHKGSQTSMDETFSLSNMCPQVGEGFNRDYWARFERFARDATEAFDDVWVVTGPLYIPKPGPRGWTMEHPMLGSPPQLLAVPTHFFKVILAENKSGVLKSETRALGAFVMPNAPIQPAHPLAAFAVPITALESVAGIEFFPTLLDDAKRAEVDKSALTWQQQGKAEAARTVKAIAGGQPPLLLPASTAPESNARGRGRPRAKAAEEAAEAAKAAELVAPGLVGHLCDAVPCRLPVEEFWKKKGEPKSLR